MSLRSTDPPRVHTPNGANGANGDREDRRVRRKSDPERPSLVEVARTAAEDLVDLFTAQLKLARLELADDLRQGLRRVSFLMLFGLPVVVGYAFGMAALASWLADYWGRSAALAAVAGLQIVGGGAGVAWAVSRLKQVHILKRASMEAADSVHLSIAAVSDGSGLSKRHSGPPEVVE
jgi:uncharacterized membrane protein YqjE